MKIEMSPTRPRLRREFENDFDGSGNNDFPDDDDDKFMLTMATTTIQAMIQTMISSSLVTESVFTTNQAVT